jgi:hypothetical protein
MATINAASASYADVSAAIALASAGDIVTVPAGSATWTSRLLVEKGISIIGAGISNTVITGAYDAIDSNLWNSNNYLFKYSPDSSANNTPFRLSGLTIDPDSRCRGFFLSGYSWDEPTIVRIDHVAWVNCDRLGLVSGAVYGVVDNCVITNSGTLRFWDSDAWDHLEFVYGSSNCLYFEDNTIECVVDDMFYTEGGGRCIFRHNTMDCTSLGAGYWPLFELHGNDANTSGIGAEIYENEITAGGNAVRLVLYRGGKTLTFNNEVTTTGAVESVVREEVYDSNNPPPTTLGGQPQYVSDTYIWGNTKNASPQSSAYISGGEIDYGGATGVVPRENVHFWNHNASFDGTTGVGVGLLAARPAACTKGVGYWATDTETLYRSSATNTWEEYYKPYTYPHPLREEGEEMANKTISFNLVVTAASDFFLAVAPASLEINPGNTATFTISVTGAGGYNKQLRFTATGVPAGCLATFSPVTIGAGQSTVLTIITPGTLSLGTYALTATATEV